MTCSAPSRAAYCFTNPLHVGMGLGTNAYLGRDTCRNLEEQHLQCMYMYVCTDVVVHKLPIRHLVFKLRM